MTARFADDITEGDLFMVAYRNHLEGIGARLCPRVAFESCDSPPCAKWWAAFRAREA